SNALCLGRFSKGLARCSKRGNKQLHFLHFTRLSIDDVRLFSCIIDKCLFACLVHLPHPRRLPPLVTRASQLLGNVFWLRQWRSRAAHHALTIESRLKLTVIRL